MCVFWVACTLRRLIPFSNDYFLNIPIMNQVWVVFLILSAGYFFKANSLDDWHGNLGVVTVRMYAKAPISYGPGNTTVDVTVWLRRMGGAGTPHALVHQKQESIRALVWIQDPNNLHLRKYSHLQQPTLHSIWSPQLVLEAPTEGSTISPVLETTPAVMALAGDPELRPYSFRFNLPLTSRDWNCFKLRELSFPLHQYSFCLPLDADMTGLPHAHANSSQPLVCATVAPPDIYTVTKPALWAVIPAARQTSLSKGWKSYYSQFATILEHYTSYHLTLGYTGVMIYADRLVRYYLRKEPAVMHYLRSGQIRFIVWEMSTRSHTLSKEEVLLSGEGPPLNHGYDHAIAVSFANLGLSACGANVMLLIADLDEFLYVPHPSMVWPNSLALCMDGNSTSSSDEPVSMYVLKRVGAATSSVPPNKEVLLWSTPTHAAPGISEFAFTRAAGRQLKRRRSMLDEMQILAVSGDRSKLSAAAESSRGGAWPLAQHPLTNYDLRAKTPLPLMHGKNILRPAAYVVAFFVHEGVPLYGKKLVVDMECLHLQHVDNMFGPRVLRHDDFEQAGAIASNWIFNGSAASRLQS